MKFHDRVKRPHGSAEERQQEYFLVTKGRLTPHNFWLKLSHATCLQIVCTV
jgi:hypothetical protein